MQRFLLLGFLAASPAFATTRVTMVRNERVIVYDEIVHPAETEAGSEGMQRGCPCITVFFGDATIRLSIGGQESATTSVSKGQAIFRGPGGGRISAAGSAEVHFVRIEFMGPGSSDVWGMDGLPPDDRLLVENQFARVYAIRIPVGASEPQHSQHGRVLVILSGAELRQTLPDGRRVDVGFKAGSCVWRPASTHAGRNVGRSDYWAVAVEPK